MARPLDVPYRTIEHDFLEYTALYLHALTDVHVGAHRYDKGSFEWRLKQIKAAPPNHRVLLGGDLQENAIIHSVAAQHGGGVPQEEIMYLADVLEPLADRIDLIIPGNHEARTNKHAGIALACQLASLLRIPHVYRSGMSVVRYRWGRRGETSTEFRYYAEVMMHHGYGGGRKQGATINKVQDLVQQKSDCDLYLMGHHHRQSHTADSVILGWPGRSKRRNYVQTGTYLGTEAYAENCALAPPLIGAPMISLEGEKKRGEYRVKINARLDP